MGRTGWFLVMAAALSASCATANPVQQRGRQPATPAPATVAQVPPAPSAATDCQRVSLTAVTDSPVVALFCPTHTAIPGLQTGDALANYYGYVTATTRFSAMEASQRRSLGDFFRRMFRTDTFTAEVSMSLELQTSDGVTPLAERPLMIIQRKQNGDTEVDGSFAAFTDAQVSPFFALNAANPGVQVRFRVRRVNDNQFRVADIARAAAEVAASQGAEGWLATGISEPVVLSALNRSQQFVSDYFSDQVTVSTTSRLTFSSGGQTGAVFDTGWNEGLPAAIRVSVQLNARQSLVTEVLRDNPTPSPDRPDILAVAPGDWATRIIVSPAVGGAPSKSLNSVLTQSGVPRRLTDLGASSAAAATPLQQVDAACRDLSRALSDNEYFRLNQIDANLILFDQLRSAGVFERFAATQLGCVSQKLDFWRALGLDPSPPVDLSFNGMRFRLNALSRDWKAGTPEARRNLQDSFFSPSTIKVPATLVPSAIPFITVIDGVTDGAFSSATLAESQLTCLGDYKKIGPSSAHAFARVAGHDALFQATFTFALDEGQGVMIQSLAMRPATAEERSANPAASCVSG